MILPAQPANAKSTGLPSFLEVQMAFEELMEVAGKEVPAMAPNDAARSSSFAQWQARGAPKARVSQVPAHSNTWRSARRSTC